MRPGLDQFESEEGQILDDLDKRATFMSNKQRLSKFDTPPSFTAINAYATAPASTESSGVDQLQQAGATATEDIEGKKLFSAFYDTH